MDLIISSVVSVLFGLEVGEFRVIFSLWLMDCSYKLFLENDLVLASLVF